MTFYNDSQEPLKLLVAGPTVHYYTTETQDWVEQVSGSFASKPGWEQWQYVYTSPT